MNFSLQNQNANLNMENANQHNAFVSLLSANVKLFFKFVDKKNENVNLYMLNTD
jgi:hypothetical protein